MRRTIALLAASCALVLLIGCAGNSRGGPTIPPGDERPDDGDAQPGPQPPGQSPAGLLQPSELSYAGAFRLPEASGGSSWEWGGDGMAYNPGGDPDGPDDGFPGSIFGVGHDWDKHVSEISIPEPVVSGTKSLDALNTAGTLQSFRDVRGGVGRLDALQEMVRVGMACLPPQGGQGSGKLYLCWGQHLQEEAERVASHMWCELDLSGSQGAWWVDAPSIYSVNDYMFEIPQAWAEANAPGMRLASGRFRDGGWSGQGPALYAIGPWNHGNPPPDETVLDAVPLLQYSRAGSDEPQERVMDGYHHSDEWAGGAWLTSGDRAAVVFVGTKGTGECWYGLPDGTVWEAPYPDDPENQRGWWSSGFVGEMLFYDPSELAAVARGEMQPWEPQPYATLAIDEQLYHVTSGQQKHHAGACAFDREHGRLYVFEPLADGDRPLVHVWSVR
ncbi:MAG: hypothetical protein ACP5KN_05165 [Armatimonadota bacterium]